MMVTIRKAAARGKTKIDWLESYHTFSFGDYYDPQHMGFSDLRVINDDIVSPSQGFGMHSHRDMEIITVVLSGQLAHKDSMGNGAVIYPGEVQYMRAGTGVQHSEFNPSTTEPVHLLQIWILPNAKGLAPQYQQKQFNAADTPGKPVRIISGVGATGAIQINQDVEIDQLILSKDKSHQFSVDPARKAWIHIATGQAKLNGQILEAGDAAAVLSPEALTLTGTDDMANILLFNLKD